MPPQDLHKPEPDLTGGDGLAKRNTTSNSNRNETGSISKNHQSIQSRNYYYYY